MLTPKKFLRAHAKDKKELTNVVQSAQNNEKNNLYISPDRRILNPFSLHVIYAAEWTIH